MLTDIEETFTITTYHISYYCDDLNRRKIVYELNGKNIDSLIVDSKSDLFVYC